MRKVLPYETVQDSGGGVGQDGRSAERYEPSGKIHVGFDISDTGSRLQRVGRAPRPGAVPLRAMDRPPAATARAVYRSRGLGRDQELCTPRPPATPIASARELGAARMYYDASGLGGPMRSLLTEIAQEKGKAYRRHGVLFGGAVAGPTVKFNRTDNNEDYFYRRNSQLWWGLQLRALRTQRLLDGHAINPDDCLFIDRSGIANLERLMIDLSSAGVGAGRERPHQGREAAEDRGGAVGEDGIA